MVYIENKIDDTIVAYLNSLKENTEFPTHLIPLVEFFVAEIKNTEGAFYQLEMPDRIDIINTYLPTKYKIK